LPPFKQRVGALARRSVPLARGRIEALVASVRGPSSIEAVDVTQILSMFMFARRQAVRERAPWRPNYLWATLRSAMTAKAIGIQKMSIIEFGVARGSGLRALETAATAAESLLEVDVEVYGFDTGRGMPHPTDPRDAPFAIVEGDYTMDVAALHARLRRADLILGLVEETVPRFVSTPHAPIGFISFDLDYYTATIEALRVLEQGEERLLPRVLCYFDDLYGYPYTEFNGERAAINDFNARHEHRKISPLYGLSRALPWPDNRAQWPDAMHIAELFDHRLFAAPEVPAAVGVTL
jgi:hypothetical protein